MPTKGNPVVDPPFHQTVALAFRCKFACQHGTYKKIPPGDETLVNQELGRDECVEWTEEQQTELLALLARRHERFDLPIIEEFVQPFKFTAEQLVKLLRAIPLPCRHHIMRSCLRLERITDLDDTMPGAASDVALLEKTEFGSFLEKVRAEAEVELVLQMLKEPPLSDHKLDHYNLVELLNVLADKGWRSGAEAGQQQSEAQTTMEQLVDDVQAEAKRCCQWLKRSIRVGVDLEVDPQPQLAKSEVEWVGIIAQKVRSALKMSEDNAKEAHRHLRELQLSALHGNTVMSLRAIALSAVCENKHHRDIHVGNWHSNIGRCCGGLARCRFAAVLESMTFLLTHFLMPLGGLPSSAMDVGLDILVAIEQYNNGNTASFLLILGLVEVPNIAMAIISVLWGFPLLPTKQQVVPEWLLALLGVQFFFLAFRLISLSPYDAKSLINLPGLQNFEALAMLSSLCHLVGDALPQEFVLLDIMFRDHAEEWTPTEIASLCSTFVCIGGMITYLEYSKGNFQNYIYDPQNKEEKESKLQLLGMFMYITAFHSLKVVMLATVTKLYGNWLALAAVLTEFAIIHLFLAIDGNWYAQSGWGGDKCCLKLTSVGIKLLGCLGVSFAAFPQCRISNYLGCQVTRHFRSHVGGNSLIPTGIRRRGGRWARRELRDHLVPAPKDGGGGGDRPAPRSDRHRRPPGLVRARCGHNGAVHAAEQAQVLVDPLSRPRGSGPWVARVVD
jgi:hypothetical protein